MVSQKAAKKSPWDSPKKALLLFFVIDWSTYTINNDTRMVKINNDILTKAYLDKKLKDYATKTYIDRGLYKLKEDLRFEISEDIKGLADKNDLIQFKDEILTEIKKLREDDEAHRFSHMRINDELQEHSKQVAKLQAQ